MNYIYVSEIGASMSFGTGMEGVRNMHEFRQQAISKRWFVGLSHSKAGITSCWHRDGR